MQNFVTSFFNFKSHLLVKRVFYLLNVCIKRIGNRISALLPVGTHSVGAGRQTDRATPNHKSRQRLRIAKLNPLNAELNPICHLLALLGAHHFLHVSRIRVKLLTLRLLMSYIYIYIYIWSTYS